MHSPADPTTATATTTTTTTSSSSNVLLGKYRLGRLLGRGNFAKVYIARSLADGSDLAVKVMDKTKILNATMEPRVISEISVMRRLRHPNIIRIHEVMATKSKIYLAMEYARGGELLAKISRHKRFTEPVARFYFQQLVSSLYFCHRNGVAHRDLKPQNLLLDEHGNLKISDFGLSALPEQLKDGLLYTACGTPAYTAPEVVCQKGYDGAKADAWSCGVILFAFLAGFLPFDDSNIAVMYRRIRRREFQFPSWFSKPVKWIISRLLDPNPETRISIEAVMEVGWFKKSLQEKDQNPNQQQMQTLFNLQLTMSPDKGSMNAFDIISLSSGLDLSALFEGKRKWAKRFTSMIASPERIVKRVTEAGEKLGYTVERRKKSVIGLGKERLGLLIELLEVAPSVFMVQVRVGNGEGGMELVELQWGELKLELEDMVLAWHNDCV
ncbi:CBL-interacting serine/threonine-protein kinase 4-like isoform X2 [Telopea speciosissima]|uniref:CBL-interacting serine/threonine-protein kinase 4-like isoform X2 n=1 Tax=Telopea speciosissima TaxID=54955 RepID=UPI001CC5B57F|nr:CBL-interacting serine/threonine-protein kinase 4-like isoform X2 [Telopea speciosissima]